MSGIGVCIIEKREGNIYRSISGNRCDPYGYGSYEVYVCAEWNRADCF